MSDKRKSRRVPDASKEESTIIADYNARYRAAAEGPQLAIERSVCGTDYGVTSFTTAPQAERLIHQLGLRATHRVLDLGTGCGWPGLHLSLRTGCEMVGSDLPLAGLRSAGKRAIEEGISSRVDLVQSSARHLPFRARSFDAIVHADVLC